MRVGILTLSDGCASGDRDDLSGVLIERWCAERGYDVGKRAIMPDDRDTIARTLIDWADRGGVGLILTTGGTGLTQRDVTPEATKAAIEREAPGIAEAMRAYGLTKTPLAALSRGIVGARGETLIVNLPGSPAGVTDGLAAIDSIVDHAVALLTDSSAPHETNPRD